MFRINCQLQPIKPSKMILAYFSIAAQLNKAD